MQQSGAITGGIFKSTAASGFVDFILPGPGRAQRQQEYIRRQLAKYILNSALTINKIKLIDWSATVNRSHKVKFDRNTNNITVLEKLNK